MYWARYEVDGTDTGPQVAKPADLDLDGAIVTGAGATLHPEILGVSLGVDHPTVPGLLHRALERLVQGAPTETVEPLYLRRPDAVVPTGRKSTVQS